MVFVTLLRRVLAVLQRRTNPGSPMPCRSRLPRQPAAKGYVRESVSVPVPDTEKKIPACTSVAEEAYLFELLVQLLVLEYFVPVHLLCSPGQKMLYLPSLG